MILEVQNAKTLISFVVTITFLLSIFTTQSYAINNNSSDYFVATSEDANFDNESKNCVIVENEESVEYIDNYKNDNALKFLDISNISKNLFGDIEIS